MRSKLMGAILQFPQLIERIPVVAGNPGHGRAAQVHTVMVGPDSLPIAFDQDPVRTRAAGLHPAVSFQRRQYPSSLRHDPTVGHGAVSHAVPDRIRGTPARNGTWNLSRHWLQSRTGTQSGHDPA